MNTASAQFAFFSPTGTTRRVLEGIAAGLAHPHPEFVDVTRSEDRGRSLRARADDLLVIGVPVYIGRVPALLEDWFGRVEGDGTPAVCVVVYGNRAFENALLELHDTVSGRGFVPVAGGAFIGEHSFSSAQLPTAQGRPDGADLDLAAQFGRKIRSRLDAASSPSELRAVDVPGERPYGGITTLWDVDFVQVGPGCRQCGLCAETCPVGAIDPADSSRVDTVRCITCCSCIRKCPQQARSMRPGPVMDAANRLASLHGDRKLPQCFL